MLPKHLRLPSSEIEFIAKRGKRIGNKETDVRVWYDDELENPLFAISVSKKNFPKAVQRNRVKRKLRAEIIKLMQEKPEKVRKGKYLILPYSEEISQISEVFIK